MRWNSPITFVFLLFLATAGLAQNDPTGIGDSLRYVSPSIGTTHMNAITGDGSGRLLVVGEDGAISSSTDNGENWTFHHLGQRDIELTGAIYGAGLFFVTRANRDPLVTADFSSWEVRPIPGVNRAGFIEYLNGQFIAFSRSAMATSTDGENWQVIDYPPTAVVSITFGQGMYVAAGGNGAIYTSLDLLSWEQRDSDTDDLASNANSFSNVRFSEDAFIAVGVRGLVSISLDGIDWQRYDPGASAFIFDGIKFNGKYLIPVGSGSVDVSEDLVTWERQRPAPNTQFSFYVAGGTLYTVGRIGLLQKTTDGVTWESAQNSAVTPYNAMASGEGVLVAGNDLGEIYSSSDGLVWSLRKSSSTKNNFVAIEFNGTDFVSVQNDNTVLQSSDGMSWVEKAPVPDRIRGLAYGAGVWVAVGDNGKISITADLESWQSVDSGGTDFLDDVAFGSNLFVAVGIGGTILTSPDGTTWTRVESDITARLNNVAYGAGRWVVSGQQSSLHSVDTISWEEIDFPRPSITNWMKFVDGHFLAIGYLGGMDHSTDGITWTKERTQSNATITGIAYHDDRWVTVGDQGTHMVTDPDVEWNVFAGGSQGGTVTSSIDLTAPVADGTPITLTATPADGFIFSYWTGALENDDEPTATFMATEDTIVTAVFIPTPFYEITFDIRGNGSVQLDPPLPTFAHGSQVTLTAVADDGNIFQRWQGSVPRSTDNPLTITVERNHSITVDFRELAQRTLRTRVTGEGSVVVSPEAETYLEGTDVTVTAVPADGYEFVRWTGNLSGNENPAVVNMASNRTVTAVFELATVTYSLTVLTNGSGTVQQSPSGPTHPAGTEVTLTPIPDPGYRFSRWTGSAGGAASPLVIIMSRDNTITAEFEHASAFGRWAKTQFSEAELANPLASGPTVDLDGDGFDNFSEFYANTLPKLASSYPGIGATTVREAGEVYFALTWIRPKDPDPASVSLDTSTDGTTWVSETLFEVVSTIPTGDGYESITARLPKPINALNPKRLARLSLKME